MASPHFTTTARPASCRNGRIIAAAQEERFTRKKHDASFPRFAAEYCLKAGGLAAQEVDYVAFYEKPFVKFDRIIHSYRAYAPIGIRSFLKAIPLWIKEKKRGLDSTPKRFRPWVLKDRQWRFEDALASSAGLLVRLGGRIDVPQASGQTAVCRS